MKVIVSIDPVRFPLTGIGRYTWELANRLNDSDSISELKLLSGHRFLTQLPVPSDGSDNNYFLRRLVQRSQLASDAYQFIMPALKAHTLRGHDDYLFHGPNFFIPPFAGRKVATFHDLSPFTWSDCYTPQRARYTQRELLKTIRSADALITDSEYIRQELSSYFSWPLARIHTVPLASSGAFHPRSVEELAPVLRRYELAPGGYTLFVSTIEPRKNIVALLDAYGSLPAELKERYPLVLSGYRGWRSDAIHARIEQAQRQGWVRYLGYSPAEHLPYLFSGARLFAFPSHYEGFGLPVLEAMASGIPIVCSNSSSLPEVVGECALTSHPADIDALLTNLRKGLLDDEWREVAVCAGLERSRQFSWERCVASTVDVYKSLGN